MRAWWLILAAGCGRVNFDDVGNRDAADPRDSAADGAADSVGGSLVAWYPFDDTAMNTADLIGHTNGTCTGSSCPASTTGHNAGAFLFDAVDDCIEIQDQGQLDLPQLTVSIWARLDAADACSMFAKRVDIGANTLDSWQLETTANRELVLTTNEGATSNHQQLTATGALSLGVWHHFAFTYDGVQGAVYLDGVDAFGVSQPTGPLSYDNHSLWIGCDDQGGGFGLHWNGAIDDMRIYNRVLSLYEIQTLASH